MRVLFDTRHHLEKPLRKRVSETVSVKKITLIYKSEREREKIDEKSSRRESISGLIKADN